jgi:hypothetical protein
MGTLMKSFKTFNEATVRTLTFTFGRFNPPTVGHLKLMDATANLGGEYRIYVSQSQDPKKNPLSYKQKLKYMKEMFPKHAKNIITDTSVKTGLDVLFKAYEEGYTQINFVVGSDRVPAFQFFKKYNGVEAKGQFYDFVDGINIVSAGERDPDSDDVVAGMSASKLRKAAEEGDIKLFETGMPTGYKRGHELFNDIRVGMKLKAITNFREHVQLPSVSMIREQFIRGQIFKIGSSAGVKSTGAKFVIESHGPNFVTDKAGKKYFLQDLSPQV